MHAIGIRRSLVERHPWVAVSVYKAFLRAKDVCMHELGQIGHLATSLPWSVAESTGATRHGRGFLELWGRAERHVLDTLARYSFEQESSVRQLRSRKCLRPPRTIYRKSDRRGDCSIARQSPLP